MTGSIVEKGTVIEVMSGNLSSIPGGYRYLVRWHEDGQTCEGCIEFIRLTRFAREEQIRRKRRVKETDRCG